MRYLWVQKNSCSDVRQHKRNKKSTRRFQIENEGELDRMKKPGSAVTSLQPWALWLLPVCDLCGGSFPTTPLPSAAVLPVRLPLPRESWGDVKLTMWGAEEDQTMLREMADAFIEQNADKGNVTIEIGVQSESSAKDTVLADPESAADVFAFADDQLNELVNAGALQEVLLNPDDVKSRNLPGSVGAATMNDKLYAYPATADNGYFLYYECVHMSLRMQSMDTCGKGSCCRQKSS